MAAAKKPWNLVIITADDLNADSTGWMGSKVGATPAIDAFAATGHQFRNCHAVVPLCQPARAVLMTGLVPHRNGALGFDPVRPAVTTMTELMRDNGYLTAAINKSGHMMPRPKFDWDLIMEGSGKNPSALRAHLEKCLKTAAGQGKPFFINANSTDPHGPYPGSGSAEPRDPQEHQGRLPKQKSVAAPVQMFTESEIVVPSFLEDLPVVRREIAQYFSAVRRLDHSFGELIGALKAAGRMEDTVVVFLSDHGISMPFAKATLYRNGTWSPVLLRWPGMSGSAINTDMVMSSDLMPTLLDLLELNKPHDLDGNSWLPLLQGQAQSGRDHVFTQIDTISAGKNFPSRCVRTKTRSYIWNAWSNGKARFGIGAMHARFSWQATVEAGERNPALKSRVDHFIYRSPEEFYDVEKDPDERHNLIEAPDCQTEISRMKTLLLAHMEETADPLVSQFGRVCRAAQL